MNQKATTIGTWAHAIARALDSYGLDGQSICRQFEIDTQRLTDPNYRIPVTTMTPLWAEAVNLSGDSAFGLRVADNVSPTTFHALGFAALASRDFQDVAKRIMSNTDVISEVAQMGMEVKDQSLWLTVTIKPDSPEVRHEALDAFIGSLIQMGRKFVGLDVPMAELYLQRPRPENHIAFDEFFKVPIYYEHPVNALVCPLSVINTLMPSYNPALIEANEKVLRDYKATQHQSLTNRIISAIEELLPDEPAQAKVAERLNMSVRKLQRALEAEQTNYQALLDDYRKQKALTMLEAGKLSLKIISFELGFANQSAFTRAFKRWTGNTPNYYLKKPSKTAKSQ